MKLSREKSSTDKRRFVIRQRSSYGTPYLYIIDQESGSDKPFMVFIKRSWAEGVLTELNRDPKIIPGARVRLAGWVKDFGASEPNDLFHVTEDRYSAGEEGVLSQPHPNQSADGCRGWWYIEVDSKIGEPRKLLVAVMRDGFELI